MTYDVTHLCNARRFFFLSSCVHVIRYIDLAHSQDTETAGIVSTGNSEIFVSFGKNWRIFPGLLCTLCNMQVKSALIYRSLEPVLNCFFGQFLITFLQPGSKISPDWEKSEMTRPIFQKIEYQVFMLGLDLDPKLTKKSIPEFISIVSPLMFAIMATPIFIATKMHF